MTSWRSFLSPWLHGHLVPWRPISLRTSGPVLGMVTVGIVFERRFLAKELFEDFLDLANVLLIFSSFHNFASISAWVFFIQELQQEAPTRHFGSFAWGWEAGKLHCSHINNTQACYMMYEEISPGLRNCFLSVLD